MFETPEEARRSIRDAFGSKSDYGLNERQIEMLVGKLQRQFWVGPASTDVATLGTTRFGGAPDRAKGSVWPTCPVDETARKRLHRYIENKPGIRPFLEHELPFEFIAQIDLAEAHAHGDLASALPREGRLLFFWNGEIGVYESHARWCRILHDETPASELERLDVPAAFEQMEAWWRSTDAKQIAHFEGMLKSLRASGQKDAAREIERVITKLRSPDPNKRKPFVSPAAQKTLMPIWVLPDAQSADTQADPALWAFARADATRDAYASMTAMDDGFHERDGRSARRNRMLGPPMPEQDDPRYDAVTLSGLLPEPTAKAPWSDAMQSEAGRLAREWVLLLQVDMADLTQERFAEGTVYFLIHRDALAKRDFTGAIAVCQQT